MMKKFEMKLELHGKKEVKGYAMAVVIYGQYILRINRHKIIDKLIKNIK